jgi:hypothetical protein
MPRITFATRIVTALFAIAALAQQAAIAPIKRAPLQTHGRLRSVR